MYSLNTVIFAAVGGAVVGGAAVFATVVVPMEQKLRKRIDEETLGEIQKVREYYEKERTNVVKENPADNPSSNEGAGVPSEDGGEDRLPVLEEETVEVGEAEEVLDAIIVEQDYAMVNDDTYSPEEDLYHQDENTKTGIELVDENLAEHNEWDYTRVFMKYFLNDGILVDSDDVPIEDPNRVIGEYVEDAKTNDLLYVVNHNLDMLIEVERYDEDYRDYIYGRRDHKDPLYQTPGE